MEVPPQDLWWSEEKTWAVFWVEVWWRSFTNFMLGLDAWSKGLLVAAEISIGVSGGTRAVVDPR